MGKIKGIIFDMDNTLLRSKIDFESMKQETFHFLVSRGILSEELPITEHTSSTIIEAAKKTNRMTEELLMEMWDISKKFEIIGMEGADLEPGVKNILEELKGSYHMTVVTNNSTQAAETALRDNQIINYFELVVGREMMKSIKPAPDGFQFVLDQYSSLAIEDWISIGDAWVDGKASIAAGVQFISYQGDVELMKKMGVIPYASITDINELKAILQ